MALPRRSAASLGLAAGTLAFAVVHVPMEREALAMASDGRRGRAVLAAAYELSGGLVAPIAIHFAINALNLRWWRHEPPRSVRHDGSRCDVDVQNRGGGNRTHKA